jgi:hypothetical protein
MEGKEEQKEKRPTTYNNHKSKCTIGKEEDMAREHTCVAN